MCGGPTQQQQTLSNEQNAFYAEMTKEYSTIFAEDQSILTNLTNVFTPILNAGPDQEGFGPNEKSAIQSQINEGNAGNFKDAQKQLETSFAAKGGGDSFLPSGSEASLEESLVSGAEAERSREELTATEADYATGRQNFTNAEEALGMVSGRLNPASFATSTTGAGSAASQTANEIAQESNSVWGDVFGALGGIAGSSLGTKAAGNLAPSIFG